MLQPTELQILFRVTATEPLRTEVARSLGVLTAQLVARKLRELGKNPEDYVVQTADIKQVDVILPGINGRNDVWQLDLLLPKMSGVEEVKLSAYFYFELPVAKFCKREWKEGEEKFISIV